MKFSNCELKIMMFKKAKVAATVFFITLKQQLILFCSPFTPNPSKSILRQMTSEISLPITNNAQMNPPLELFEINHEA